MQRITTRLSKITCKDDHFSQVCVYTAYEHYVLQIELPHANFSCLHISTVKCVNNFSNNNLPMHRSKKCINI